MAAGRQILYLGLRHRLSCAANDVQSSLPLYVLAFGTIIGRPPTSSGIPQPLNMEHTRDDNSSPHPVDGPATPFLSTTHGGGRDADDPAPSPPPSSTVNSQHSDDKSWFPSLRSLRLKLADLRLKLPQSKPLFQGLERPSFSRIATLTVLCLITYPVFYILTLVAKDKSLFIVRSVVSVWCSGVGFALGYILLKIGAQHLEAASEFTSVDCIETISDFIPNSLGHCDSHEL